MDKKIIDVYTNDYGTTTTYEDGSILFEKSDGSFWSKTTYNEDGSYHLENSLGIKADYDSQGREYYVEDSDGKWTKTTYDDNGNTYSESSDGSWCKKTVNEDGSYHKEYSFGGKEDYDTQDRIIYSENSDGHWVKTTYNEDGSYLIEDSSGTINEFDSQNRNIYFETSGGYWVKKTYNEDGSYHKENSDGDIEEYDTQNRLIYSEYSNGYWTKITYSENGDEYQEHFDGTWSKKTYNEDGSYHKENSYGDKEDYDSQNRLIYFEDSDGSWIKIKYDENGGQYSESSDGSWSKTVFNEDGSFYNEDSSGNYSNYDSKGRILYKKLIVGGNSWESNYKYNSDDDYWGDSSKKMILSSGGVLVFDKDNEAKYVRYDENGNYVCDGFIDPKRDIFEMSFYDLINNPDGSVSLNVWSTDPSSGELQYKTNADGSRSYYKLDDDGKPYEKIIYADGSYILKHFLEDGSFYEDKYDSDGKAIYYGASDGRRIYKYFDGDFQINVDGTCTYIVDGTVYTGKLHENGIYALDDGKTFYKVDDNSISEVDSSGNIINAKDVINKKRYTKGEVSYINAINIDTDKYNLIMDTLNRLSDKRNVFKTEVNKLNSDMDYLPDNKDLYKIEYNESFFEDIMLLKENVNYSVLACKSYDEDLKDMLVNLISEIFDSKEDSLSSYFKFSIDSKIEDDNGKKVFKKDTDFRKLHNDIIPVYSFTDSNGNSWFFNNNKNLISVTGNNPTIKYGNEEFVISVKDGYPIAKDSNGNSLNIFADYNIDSRQYGGDQGALLNFEMLLKDDSFMSILNKYYPATSMEEKEAYLEKIVLTGCGYVMVTNAVFKSMEGREEDFYNVFGYPMYNIKFDDETKSAYLDYNYEPLVLDLYSKCNDTQGNIDITTFLANGTNDDVAYEMFNYLREKDERIFGKGISYYDAMINDNYVCFGDYSYSLYDMDGNLYLEYGGSHAMTKLGETELNGEKYWIVSTWGEKSLCKPYNPDFYHIGEGDYV